MKNRLNNLFKFGRIKAHGSRSKVQVEQLSGEIHSDIEHPQEFGFESKAPIGSKTYSAYRGGNQESGAVLIIAGQAPINIADGDSIMYSAGGATVHCIGGKIEISGTAFGGLIKITDLTIKLNAFIASFNGHSHVSAGVIDTVAAPFVAVDYENGDVEHG